MKTQLKDKKLLKQVGRRLQQLRKTAGLKQEHVASDLGIKQETLSKYENGGTDISVCALMAFARYFKVDCSSLIIGCPNPVTASSGNSANGIANNQHSHPNEGYPLYVAPQKSRTTFLKDHLKAGKERNELLQTTLMLISLTYG